MKYLVIILMFLLLQENVNAKKINKELLFLENYDWIVTLEQIKKEPRCILFEDVLPDLYQLNTNIGTLFNKVEKKYKLLRQRLIIFNENNINYIVGIDFNYYLSKRYIFSLNFCFNKNNYIKIDKELIFEKKNTNKFNELFDYYIKLISERQADKQFQFKYDNYCKPKAIPSLKK